MKRLTFEQMRQQLIDSYDYESLLRAGHELRDGAILTSMSAAPFEMSFKCIHCGRSFWFENPAWRKREPANWRFTSETREELSGGCLPVHPAIVAAQLKRRGGMVHP